MSIQEGSSEWEIRLNFKCTSCGSLQHKASELIAHSIGSHCKNRFYWCHDCKTYSTNDVHKLYYHIECVHDDSSCMVCPLCFDFYGCNEKDIEDHIYRNHWTIQQVYCCNLCRYKCEYSIAQHLQKTHKSFSEELKGSSDSHPPPFVKSEINYQQTYTNDQSYAQAYPEICEPCSCNIMDCNFFAKDSCQMFQHIVSTHFPCLHSEYKCIHCDDTSNSEDTCVYSATVNIICTLCPNYKCQRKNTYMKHMKNYHDLIVFNCPFDCCDYETDKFWDFWSHAFDVHINNVMHECPICYAQCWNESELDEHFKDYHYGNLYPICNCLITGSVVKHLKEFHDLEFPEFPCRLCGMELDEDEDLHEHLAEIHGIFYLEAFDNFND